MDVKSSEFFKNARRTGLWPKTETIHRSTLTKARQKVPWQIFEAIFYDAVKLAYAVAPQNPEDLWHGRTVLALDGSKVNLPATPEIRQAFDPESGLHHPGKGHYPQSLVCTACDVFRRFPVARTVSPLTASEREEAKALIAHIPPGNVLLFDRGYPGYEFIHYLVHHYAGDFILRCPATSTFPAVERFLKGHQEEGVIWIDPSNKYLSTVSPKDRKRLKPVKLRIIKLHSPDGTLSVLLTTLFDYREFPRQEIMALYFRRWEVETYYRYEKMVMEIEKFHSRTGNGIRQELFAAAIMSVISRTLMRLTIPPSYPQGVEPQFKNAVLTLASEAALLVPDRPEKAVAIFKEILADIARVKYYRPKTPRPSQPRVTKLPINKWCLKKIKNLLKPLIQQH